MLIMHQELAGDIKCHILCLEIKRKCFTIPICVYLIFGMFWELNAS